MKFTSILIIGFVLLIAMFSAGCISQTVSTTADTPVKPEVSPGSQTTDSIQSDSNSGAIQKNTQNNQEFAGKYYYNIRIVPVSVLDQLEREISQGEYLIHNDKGYVIGIVSADELVIRGDLVQVEEASGSSGREFDKTDVANHLIDIVFGPDNSKISLFKSDKDYKFWFDAYFTNADANYVKNLSKFLNTISGTTQFEDEEVALGFLQTNYAVVPYNFYNIRIVTQKMLDKYFDDRTDTDHLFKDENGKLIGIVNTDRLYLIDSLKEEERHQYILKGVLYSMGLHGTSFNNRDSFFYRNAKSDAELSDLDIESIKLLYGGGLKTGNTLEDVKKTLGLPT